MTGGAKQQTSPLDPDYKPSIRANKISCGDAPLISMMKSTEFGNCDHLGIVGGLALDATSRGRFLPEIVMGPVIMVVVEVILEDCLQMPLVQDDVEPTWPKAIEYDPKEAIPLGELGLLLSSGIHAELLAKCQDLNGLMSVQTACGQGQTEPFDEFGCHGRKCHS